MIKVHIETARVVKMDGYFHLILALSNGQIVHEKLLSVAAVEKYLTRYTTRPICYVQ
jgi:hypothetical protein